MKLDKLSLLALITSSIHGPPALNGRINDPENRERSRSPRDSAIDLSHQQQCVQTGDTTPSTTIGGDSISPHSEPESGAGTDVATSDYLTKLEFGSQIQVNSALYGLGAAGCISNAFNYNNIALEHRYFSTQVTNIKEFCESFATNNNAPLLLDSNTGIAMIVA